MSFLGWGEAGLAPSARVQRRGCVLLHCDARANPRPSAAVCRILVAGERDSSRPPIFRRNCAFAYSRRLPAAHRSTCARPHRHRALSTRVVQMHVHDWEYVVCNSLEPFSRCAHLHSGKTTRRVALTVLPSLDNEKASDQHAACRLPGQGKSLSPPWRAGRGMRDRGSLQPLMKSSKSALTSEAWVVGMPCGRPL